jgi:hypothetical protein
VGIVWSGKAAQHSPVLNSVEQVVQPPQVVQPAAGAYLRHVPAMQSWSTAQGFPHPPQLFGSVLRLKQELAPPPAPHAVRPPGQASFSHEPARHDSPLAHVSPHVPQLSASPFVSTQLDPHNDRPGRHVQPPALQ